MTNSLYQTYLAQGRDLLRQARRQTELATAFAYNGNTYRAELSTQRASDLYQRAGWAFNTGEQYAE